MRNGLGKVPMILGDEVAISFFLVGVATGSFKVLVGYVCSLGQCGLEILKSVRLIPENLAPRVV